MSWCGEVEDGSGWGGLVPTKAERELEASEAHRRREAKALAMSTLNSLQRCRAFSTNGTACTRTRSTRTPS